MTARAFVLFLLAIAVRAQTPPAANPQFVWEGDVDESAVLHIRGDRLAVENPRGEGVQHQRYRFFHLPPDSRQQVRLEVVEGRGSVRITQQPALENDYTIAIDIEDRQEGRGHYSIALYWDASGDDFQNGARPWRDRGWQGDGIAEPGAATAKLTWRGHVDSEAIVECRASSCHSLVRQGMPVTRERVRFSKPLPHEEVVVNLAGDDASGNIRVLEQPLRSNGYAVRVQITEGCGARKECRFTLAWREPGAAAEKQQVAHRGVLWSGRVTGTIRVTVRGSSTLSEVVSGGPIGNEQAVVDRALPHRSDLSTTLRKVQGRGTVAIVESPSEPNGFSLVFEVRDPGPGADDYMIEVGW
ncbi:MAG: hypothetical protein ABSH47_15955 [Bryobacteraceae bacterium]|jgi:hypothetical protein